MKKLPLLFVAALLLLGACCTPAKTAKPKKEIALQLYSLREDIKKDFDATIKVAGGLGYTSVEAADYNNGKFYGRTPAAFKAAVEAAGLKLLSSHASKQLSAEELASKDFSKSLAWWDETIAAHLAAGVKYILVSWMAVPKTLADLQTYCDYYNTVGKKCKEKGLLFGYHNHSHEFTEIEGSLMYNYMLEHTNPEFVFFEMDVYWTVFGRKSPVEYFKKYPGRFTLLHIKDQKELGESGMVGFDAILKNLVVAGTKELVIEVEQYDYAPVESVKRSLDYLQGL
jgi:sugar phosphate isomerase/epimerase